ncbi:MAG: radical SAM protein [Candidatus Marinimicrobia bacterium]|nr:radical SAM protein [Candidatus Neomarinimicrobiota bacterium]
MIPKRNILRAIKKSIHQPVYALENLIKRFQAQWYYWFAKGKSPMPETLSIFITYRCNLQCKMCGQWGEKGIFKTFDKSTLQHQLSIDEIHNIISDVKSARINITLFGGEPLINPDIIRIIQIIKKAGLRCNLITNGTLIHRYANELVESGLDEIIFSLDGPELVHDEIRGIPGTYQNALKGFQKLSEIKKNKNSQKPLININSTIFESNYQIFQDTIEASRPFNPDNLTFHHLLFLDNQRIPKFQEFFQSKFAQNPTDWQGFGCDQIPSIDPQIIINQMKKLSKIRYPFNISFYPNFNDEDIINWYSNFSFRSQSYKNRCKSLWMTAYIFPDGNVRPYHTMNYNIGNIRHNRFSEIWNNEKYQNYRKYIIKHKSFEICSKGCTEFFRY